MARSTASCRSSPAALPRCPARHQPYTPLTFHWDTRLQQGGAKRAPRGACRTCFARAHPGAGARTSTGVGARGGRRLAPRQPDPGRRRCPATARVRCGGGGGDRRDVAGLRCRGAGGSPPYALRALYQSCAASRANAARWCTCRWPTPRCCSSRIRICHSRSSPSSCASTPQCCQPSTTWSENRLSSTT
jgi:hypothetical protein